MQGRAREIKNKDIYLFSNSKSIIAQIMYVDLP